MWTNLAYNVGGLFFTLDEIEHGVLRCNKGHPKDGGQPTFGVKSDARLELVLTHFDPRIHFALNCGAQSCPPIRVYSADKLDKQVYQKHSQTFFKYLGILLLHFCIFCFSFKWLQIHFATKKFKSWRTRRIRYLSANC